MMRLLVLISACGLAVAFGGCGKRAPSSTAENSEQSALGPDVDACQLIKNEEIASVVGSPVKDTKSSSQSNGGFQTAQCFYTAAEFSKSVSLAITRGDPKSPTKATVNDFWKQTFGHLKEKQNEKEEETDKENRESLHEQRREREEASAKQIPGLGEDAYWSASRVGGALYALRKGVMVRVSVGGPDNEETKLSKSKMLVQKVIDRL